MGQSWTNRVHRVMLLCVVNLSLYVNCYAGVDQGEKKVTLNVVEESCVKVFKQIEKQTKMSFFYSTSDIRLPGKVSINVVDAALDEVMGRILEGTGLEWIYSDNIITIRKKKQLIAVQPPAGNDSTITSVTVIGKVTDAAGNPIPGATVLVKRTKDGATTDEGGNFSLINVKRNLILSISSIGYQTAEIPVKGKTILVRLNVDINKLDETVVIAYGTSSKRYLTGNVAKVSAKDIEAQPVGDLSAALQGRITGLQIIQNSGAPGRQYSFVLRGKNSINSGNAPLIVIDNVPFYDGLSLDNSFIGSGVNSLSSPLSIINPRDIESIEVLKDADATAIYGSRAANGVILITTKKGKVGKTSVNLNYYSGFGRVTRTMKLLNTKDYIAMRKEALRNDHITTIPDEAYDINGTWDTAKTTDWQDKLFGETAQYTDAQASFSGGSSATQFLIGLGYHKETTVYPGDFNNQKGSLHFNINHNPENSKLRINLNGFYSKEKSVLPQRDLKNLIRTPPNAPDIYDSDGNLNWANSTWYNPYSDMLKTNEGNTDFLNANLDISYDLFPGFVIKSTMGYRSNRLEQLALTPKASFNPAEIYSQSTSAQGTNKNTGWNIEPQILYSKSWENSQIDGLLGAAFLQQNNSSIAWMGTGFSNDELLRDLKAANIVRLLSNDVNMYRYSAGFGRINYKYKNRYLINITGRRDGSSRFGPGKQFATFYAAGIGWIFSEERFIKEKLNFISFAKLRGSYGTTGNDKIGDYNYLDTYSPYRATYFGLTGLLPIRLNNPDYAWEVNKKAEIGLELGFLKDKIYISQSFYRNRSSNQLLSLPLPAITGKDAIMANLPAIVENTGYELEIKTENIKDKNFTWTTGLNLTIPRNKLVKYPGIENSPYANTYVVGKSLFIQKALNYDGVDPKTGEYTFVDVNGDGIISYPEDYTAPVFTGQQYYGGLLNELSYKNCNVTFFFQFVRQKNVPDYREQFGAPGYAINQPTYALNRWSAENDISGIQRYTTSGGSADLAFSNMLSSTGIFTDGSFIRLKNLSVSYNLPIKKLTNNRVQHCKVYLNAQNLITITSYKGYDPETRGYLPPLRVIALGIQASL